MISSYIPLRSQYNPYIPLRTQYNPYTPLMPQYNPYLLTGNSKLRAKSKIQSLVKVGEMIGATFATATVVGVGLGLTKEVTNSKILLAVSLVSIPVAFTVKALLLIFYDEKPKK